MRQAWLVVLVLLLVSLLAACAPKAAPAPAPQVPAPAAAPARAPAPAITGAAKPAWQTEWERVVAEGKKEGRVTLYTSAGVPARAGLTAGLKAAYGISLEAISGRSAETTTKLFAERRAGLYLWDIFLSGTTTLLTELKPVGALDPLEPALILPDVTDPELIKKVWWQGTLRWIDQDHYLLASRMYPQPPIAINTNLVKPDDIKSYNDLLDPKWKGKMVFRDPTIAGTSFVPALDEIMGRDWLLKLAKNEPVIMRDERLMLDWLTHGKTPIALGPKVDTYFDLKKAGAPIQAITPKEGTWVTSGSGTITLINRAAQPNAARVFINWFLSKEGQTIYSKAAGGQSVREDVPTDFLAPEEIRQPGVKLLMTEQEDAIIKKATMFNVAKEIFGSLIMK